MKYKISIIIPVFNVETYIKDTLESILKQTIGFDFLEVIIVNDCSTDGTGEIIKEYADKYENFTAITLSENNGLPGKPRNIGIVNANCDFIMFMDHDDYYDKDVCEVLYNKITEENVDMVFCNFNHVLDDGTIIKHVNTYKDESEVKIKIIDDNNHFCSLTPSIWTKIFRKSFIINNNIWFPEGILGEDLSFFIHSLIKANGIIFLNNYYGYNYRIRNTEVDKSTIHIKNKKYLHSMILGYYNTYNILKQEKKLNYFPIIFNDHLEYWMDCFITGNTTKSEKKELLNDIAFLFEKQGEYYNKTNKIFLELFDKIKNKEIDDAILITEITSIFKNKENILMIKNQNLQRQLNSNINQINKLQKAKQNLQNKILMIESSNSWKITRPLRILINKLKN